MAAVMEQQFVCITCFHTEPDAVPSEEHVIPASIGGRLSLTGLICRECNSTFGSEVDRQVLLVPEVLTAFDRLDIPHDRRGILRHNYSITARSTDPNVGEVQGRATDDGIELLPKTNLPDGSSIHPERNYEEVLRKSVLRDQRLKAAGVPQTLIESEIQRLISKYAQIPAGATVHSPVIGHGLRKRTDEFHVSVVPKSAANLERLVAKIAYEFGFVILGRDFLLAQEFAAPLWDTLWGQSSDGFGVHIFRLEPEGEYSPRHSIMLFQEGNVTRVQISFFGDIQYLLTGHSMPNDIFTAIGKSFGCEGLTGVAYQQDVCSGAIGFWALMPDGETILLEP